MPVSLSYRIFITREFERRCKKNSSYSLRAFARDLELPPSQLSEVLRCQTGLSEASAMKIAVHLKLNPSETEHFLTLVESEHSRSSVRREGAKSRLLAMSSNETKFQWIDTEKSKIISDWYYSAILELTDVFDFESNERWISKRLGISLEQTQLALQRLFQFGLLKEVNGRWIQTQTQLTFKSKVSDLDFKKHHLQILKKAESAIINQTADTREISTVTFALSSKELIKVKDFLSTMRKTLMVDAEKMKIKDRVYCLSLHLFPVDELDSRNNINSIDSQRTKGGN